MRPRDKIEVTARVAEDGPHQRGARRGRPPRRAEWLSLDKDQKQGTILAAPVREDVTLPIREQLIIELYSR